MQKSSEWRSSHGNELQECVSYRECNNFSRRTITLVSLALSDTFVQKSLPTPLLLFAYIVEALLSFCTCFVPQSHGAQTVSPQTETDLITIHHYWVCQDVIFREKYPGKRFSQIFDQPLFAGQLASQQLLWKHRHISEVPQVHPSCTTVCWRISDLHRARKIFLTGLPQLNSFSGNSFTQLIFLTAFWDTGFPIPFCFPWRKREFQLIVPKVQSLPRMPWEPRPPAKHSYSFGDPKSCLDLALTGAVKWNYWIWNDRWLAWPWLSTFVPGTVLWLGRQIWEDIKSTSTHFYWPPPNFRAINSFVGMAKASLTSQAAFRKKGMSKWHFTSYW